ncbi:hypothetical protein [Acinetobacter bereziniae]|jgi:hypothetical protein|uniref:hypothetical protein n=1 Tax=Acinetobacter bereziniae TaxID=106648 RepID=UPI00124FE4B1|nr:hypothetical protein [Acinetobacter bereziniae]
MYKKYFLSLLLFFTICCFGYIGFIFSEIKSIGSSVQWGSLKVLLFQKAPDRVWVSTLYKEMLAVKSQKESNRIDFYYSVIILGRNAFIHDAEAEAILYEYMDQDDKKLLASRLKKFKNMRKFKELDSESKRVVDRRINFLEN